MSIVLRDYQERDADRLREEYRAGRKSPLYVAPCGAGKTVLFAYMAMNAVKRGREVLINVHRQELVDQVHRALSAFGVGHTFIAGGYEFDRTQPVKIASVRTLANRLSWINPGFIIIDEAHHVAAQTWSSILQAYPTSHRLGVTATPSRLDGAGLADFFDTLVMGPSYEELTNAGYLTSIKAWAPPLFDTSNLRMQRGDFAHSDVVDRAARPSVTGDSIQHYRDIAPFKRAVVFDVSVDSARARADAFRAAGFKAECIDGTMDRLVRRDIVSAFTRGDIHVLTSVDLVSEGFDLPAIEVAISLRPTASLVLWKQQAGRVLRPSSGKDHAILLDHAGNIDRHGLPNEDREWSLESNDVVHKSATHTGVRVCLQCFAVNKHSARKCGQCGEPFQKKERHVSQKKGKLVPVTPEDLQRRRERSKTSFQQFRARDRQSLIALGRQRGMNNPEGWADHILAARAARGRS